MDAPFWNHSENARLHVTCGGQQEVKLERDVYSAGTST
ncbi:hypothetical protein D554_2021 [Bordetella holmesii 30539]|uniref:N-acetyltransferase YedL n=1 Tax=Bordetella holmesii 1058 TaxID=1247648 RepID=A0ABN0S0W6_9BORD|nr:hypothetical protein D554_2021 [Bordetella holmesii 30539]EXX95202.1 hypothetical protein D559_2633 [Bordetella holmesii 1058]